MAETQSKWALNIDKLAYGVAGVLALVALAVPLLYSGQDKSGTLQNVIEDLKKKVDSASDTTIAPPDVAQIIKDQWTPGAALTENPDWTTERPQVFLKKLEKPPTHNGTHEASSITSITCERDAKRKSALLTVKGALSDKNEYVIVRKVEILRKEGDGEPKVLKEVEPKAEFEYKDETVQPGKTYSYAVRTTAIKDPKAGQIEFDEKANGVKVSEYMGPTLPVPHEFSLQIQQVNSGDPKFFAKLQYFDYKKNDVVTVNLKEYKEGESLADGRYEVMLVDQAAGKVTIRVAGGTAKEVFGVSKEQRPVAVWAPVGGAPAPEPEAAEPPPPPAGKADAKGKPAPKAEPKAKTAPPDKAGSKGVEKGEVKGKPKAPTKKKNI